MCLSLSISDSVIMYVRYPEEGKMRTLDFVELKMANHADGRTMRKCRISETRWFQRKPHKFFDLRCLLSYVTEFSRRTDASEVSYRLTDTHIGKVP